MTGPYVTAIIPVYNDCEALQRAIVCSLSELEKITDTFELIIAEDASTDGSTELVQEWAQKDQRIVLMHRNVRLGRGSALTAVSQKARGDIICYYDVDLATDMHFLPGLIKAIEDGCDMATGSRLLPESSIIRSDNREVKSRGYNLLVRILLRSRIKDHQCGFKAFNREKLCALLPFVRDGYWFWDTEVLVRGQRAGYRICEMPVIWREGPGTTVTSHDVWKMGRAIVSLWWNLHVS